MLQKKLKGPIDTTLGMKPVAKKNHSIEKVVNSTGKKSKKRKSEQDINDDDNAVSGNLCDETGTKPSLAKKAQESKSSAGSDPRTTTATVTENSAEVDETNWKPKKTKKKNKSVDDNAVGQTEVNNQIYESKEPEENAPPAKKLKQSKPSSESNKSTKSSTVTATEGTEIDKSKKKNKQKRKKKKKNAVITPKDQDAMSEKCTLYLKEWKDNRSEWKFQKLYQIWLIQNMMDDSRVPDDIFPVFLEYISSAKGQTVQIIHEKATKVIEDAENNEADLDDPQLTRARNIIQAVVID